MFEDEQALPQALSLCAVLTLPVAVVLLVVLMRSQPLDPESSPMINAAARSKYFALVPLRTCHRVAVAICQCRCRRAWRLSRTRNRPRARARARKRRSGEACRR